MKVYFIGAGPGDPDLITVKGRRLIESCPVCIYAGSLVPEALIACAKAKDAHCINSASLQLDEIIAHMEAAVKRGQDVARLHSGDPSLYSAMHEQMRRLDALNIAYEVVPGVPAFCAAAASLKQELTIPAVTQSLILTRMALHSTPMPERETLRNLAKARATLILHLAAKHAARLSEELIPLYGASCPVIVAARVGWPDEKIIHTQLKDLEEKLLQENIRKTALIFIGWGLNAKTYQESKLYSA